MNRRTCPISLFSKKVFIRSKSLTENEVESFQWFVKQPRKRAAIGDWLGMPERPTGREIFVFLAALPPRF